MIYIIIYVLKNYNILLAQMCVFCIHCSMRVLGSIIYKIDTTYSERWALFLKTFVLGVCGFTFLF